MRYSGGGAPLTTTSWETRKEEENDDRQTNGCSHSFRQVLISSSISLANDEREERNSIRSDSS